MAGIEAKPTERTLVSRAPFGRSLHPSELPEFAKHLSDPSPARLHHYTGQSGLKGIIETGKLWATKAQYMNDATEFTLGLRLASNHIEYRLKAATESEREKLRNLFTGGERIANVNIFVACFCEKPDLLSQWRGYSGDSYGYSLALNGAKLRTRAGEAGFNLGRCIYDEQHQVAIVDELISQCLQMPDVPSMQVEFEAGLLLVSAFFKHPTFAEEQEWRIVSNVTPIDHGSVGFREGKSMLSPYFRVEIGQGKDSAIEAATIGPCPHKELSQSTVSMMFFRNRITWPAQAHQSSWPEVYISAVPYRNW